MRDDPWQAIERLEQHSGELSFAEQWRAVLRECATVLIPRLPSEARVWMAVADAYDQGHAREEDLLAARVDAWRFHDGRRTTSSPEELSALRAVMYRLWPKEIESDWYDSAWHFLAFCKEAGLKPEECFLLLKKHFTGILA